MGLQLNPTCHVVSLLLPCLAFFVLVVFFLELAVAWFAFDDTSDSAFELLFLGEVVVGGYVAGGLAILVVLVRRGLQFDGESRRFDGQFQLVGLHWNRRIHVVAQDIDRGSLGLVIDRELSMVLAEVEDGSLVGAYIMGMIVA